MEQQKTHSIQEVSAKLLPLFNGSADVVFTFLFGSLASGHYSHLSDVDIAVYVKDPHNFSFNDKLTLQADCCRALKRNDVDLVVVNQMNNLILLENIIREGEVIYVQDQMILDEFVVTKLHQVIDFKCQRERAMGDERTNQPKDI
ncbi:type VII toxin-antitoxin system MntA family adenylyltransferase antitoxin [Desulfosediminicola flagellatus]|uniref:type VII toxin-antitoxin system MntA family adenylyltransferase antitoxin n=1 Tax=Desulfosediminicola flagellatus TaxID=2569541 RepID=UPI0010ABDECA|nr:nucleotidyltransferase domain-containing protein [Desulfosediminicola flagellatus]